MGEGRWCVGPQGMGEGAKELVGSMNFLEDKSNGGV